jgi:hypothetical protein
MQKYFEWDGDVDKMELLPSVGANRRYRIFSCVLSCNENTEKAIVFCGHSTPVSGANNVVEFVDGARCTNNFGLPTPYLTNAFESVNLLSAGILGKETSGHGILVYTEESI